MPEAMQDNRIARLKVGGIQISGHSVQNRFSDLDANDDRFSIGEAVCQTGDEAEAAIRKGIKATQVECDTYETKDANCGTTVTSVIIPPDKKLACGNIGDSSAYVIIRDKKTGAVEVDQVSYTHNLSNPDEARKDPEFFEEHKHELQKFSNRITARILPKPLMPFFRKPFAEPVLATRDLSGPLADPDKEVYVMLTSDGASAEFIKNSKAFQEKFNRIAEEGDIDRMTMSLCSDFVVESVRERDTALPDNITLVLTKIPPVIEKPIAMTICDASRNNGAFSEKACDVMQKELCPNNAQKGHAVEVAPAEQGLAPSTARTGARRPHTKRGGRS